MKEKYEFVIIDLTSDKILETIKSEGKGEADRKLVELQKKYPEKKLWLKMAR